MKKIRYGVAMSLDGYIAGPKGEADWIVHDPEVNFTEIWAQYDIGLMGRGTYSPAVARLGKNAFQGMKTVVVSRTMRQEDHPEITVINELTRERVRALRDEARKDIWLFGGGELFRSMLELGEVDGIDVAVIPVVLGGGIPFLPPPAHETKLTLKKHTVYRSGIVRLSYRAVEL
ncbi:MAG TPA: dihydrofolate reductase family protein [Candidatus Acidoferrales bacterium]|nr:dihydrofolate reductase family protein [Candidatus Acidoferrales bacterium]